MSVAEDRRCCRDLNRFCSNNGRLDISPLQVHIAQRAAWYVATAVNVDEVILEGEGCMANRLRCRRKAHLQLRAGRESHVKPVHAGF